METVPVVEEVGRMGGEVGAVKEGFSNWQRQVLPFLAVMNENLHYS